jgi:uncharacterized radical SAM superfamily Fe-S cluster-containing enzyme
MPAATDSPPDAEHQWHPHRARRGIHRALGELPARLRDLSPVRFVARSEHSLSATLVVTLKRGQNEEEIGDLLRFAATQRCVRGVTLQPVHDSGRLEGFDPEKHRLTLSEVRRRTFEQFPIFAPEDLVPVPCHPDSVAMAYALRGGGDDYAQLTPLTRHVPAQVLIEGGKNTIIYEGDRALVGAVAQHLFRAFSTAHGPESAAGALKDLLCCLPRVEALPGLTYDRVFRVIIMQFLDRHTIDLRSVRKSCVHIAHPDGKRIIPFDTYNLLYRDELERERLLPLRQRVAGALPLDARPRLPVLASPS